jgi:nitroreductase
VRNQTIKDKLALKYEDRQFIKKAPVIIACCADKTRDPDYQEWEISVSLAMENILLAANELGLGACILTTFLRHPKHHLDRKEIVKALNLPPNIELIALIAVGYKDPSEKIERKELREIKEIIHWDTY